MMDILYQRGRSTAAEIHEQMADPPSYSAVRAKLKVLEDKGHITCYEVPGHAIYLPTPVVARDSWPSGIRATAFVVDVFR